MGNTEGSSTNRRQPCGLCKPVLKTDKLTTIMRAAKNGHVDCLYAKIGNIYPGVNDELLDLPTVQRETALTFAARNGHHECVDLLIRAGANVNFPVYDFTPLLEASRKGHSQCVELLLEAGAVVNYPCASFNDLICQAQIDGDQSVDVLMHTGADMSVTLTGGEAALFSAVANGYTQTVVSLIRLGVDVNTTTDCRSSALMVAAAAGSGGHTCMKLLLTLGAHVNKTNVDRKNALQICIAQSHDTTKEKCMLLYAAGEWLDTKAESFTYLGERHRVPDYLKQPELCLKHMCRETIRKHLIYLNPHLHLFGRVPELRQPKLITEYLLYDMNLDVLFCF